MECWHDNAYECDCDAKLDAEEAEAAEKNQQ